MEYLYEDRVIVIDDDEDVLEVFYMALQFAKLNVIKSSNPVQALEKIVEERIPVVVTDIMMPDLDGLKLLKKIKDRFPECIVIFVTAHATVPSLLFAIEHGAFSYLCKPFAPEELISTVKNALAKIQKTRADQNSIADLESAQKYNRTIVEMLDLPMFVVDSKAFIQRVNRPLCELLGYTDSELIFKPQTLIFNEAFIQEILPALMQKKDFTDVPVSLKRKDGTHIEIKITGGILAANPSQHKGVAEYVFFCKKSNV